VSRIYFDAMLFIYVLEAHPEHGGRVREILDVVGRRKDTLLTSMLTVGEVLAGAYKRGATDIVVNTKALLRPPVVELLPFTLETAEHYARIRAFNRVSAADGMHLACAAYAGVNLFLTNDRRLRGLVIPGIDFIAGLDVNLF